ncbi:hypothetical protein [Pantoea sp. At-9b]|uniref:hypothetical protein n=1 Tax=Pantoea sp. (strain At-9b) TaxID=592316 RepID=UPI0001B3F4FB|nr:hypothetical protein [Pantoea sp. At-9b]ADU69463.1 conserved hypothetical protein [Pantoea sp. At-9b]
MQIIPKLTSQRLAELPSGTPIRIGNQTVIFDHCAVEQDYKGHHETFVHYIDGTGQRRRHLEFTVLESGTEFTDSERCDYCGRFRHQGDTKLAVIRFWNRTEQRTFCTDRECARLYQQTISVPAARPGKPRRRAS